jgi:hypothetical protein
LWRVSVGEKSKHPNFNKTINKMKKLKNGYLCFMGLFTITALAQGSSEYTGGNAYPSGYPDRSDMQ